MKRKNLILVIFLFLPLLASFFSFLFKTNVLESVLYFLIIPSIILSFVQSESIVKSIIFSFIAIPALMIVDYICHTMGQWIVPISVFSIRIFKIVPIEDSIWVFFLTYEVIMFYEYFLDSQNKNEFVKKRFIPLFFIAYIVPVLWFIIGFQYQVIFKIDYFYALFGIVLFLIPLFLFLFKYTKMIKKFVVTGIYFFYLNFTYELTALTKNWWFFPRSSKFIGWVNIQGLFFPLEEFIFYVTIFSMGLLAWYEYFDDDRK